jgi:hypothetical protein
MEEAKSWHPYDIGDMSYHFCTLTVSHLDFLTHAGRVFLKLRQHLTTPQFHFQILIFAHVTKLRNMWEGSAHTRCTRYSKVENSPKNRWFFSAQKGWILYDFVLIYIGWSKCWPSISSSSQLNFAHHSCRCLLSIYLRIFIINKAWYLGVIFQKLVILKTAQNFKNWTKILFLKNQRIVLEVLYNSKSWI